MTSVQTGGSLPRIIGKMSNSGRRNYVMKLSIIGFHNRVESHAVVQSDHTLPRHVVFIYVT